MGTSLNEKQLEAVQYAGRHLLINAGPGSGKTSVLIERVKYLLGKGVDPREILLLTFTNRAADVMKERISDQTQDSGIWASTFHSFCYHILQAHLPEDRRNFTVADEDDQRKILKKIIRGRRCNLSPAAVAEQINLMKSKGIDPVFCSDPQYDTSDSGLEFLGVYGEYEEYLYNHKLIDFGGLQVQALDYMNEVEQFKYVMVDEFHDTSPVQLYIVEELERRCESLTVVCDDQQSIYSWRGADIANILKIPRMYPDTKVVSLERNYRSTKAIVTAINALIANAEEKLEDKKLYSERKYGTPPSVTKCYDNNTEATLVARRIVHSSSEPKDHVVLFRTNAQSRALEEAFMRWQIPYQLVAALSFYRRKEVKDVIAYLRWIYNPDDEVALTRIANVPRRGIGKKTIENTINKHGSLCSAVTRLDLACHLNDPRVWGDKLLPLRELLVEMQAFAARDKIHTVMSELLERSSYMTMLREDTSKDGVRRLENVESLLEGAASFERAFREQSTLGDYLRVVSLISDADGLDSGGSVKMMTIHAAKGTEAKHIHIVGVEEELLPHKLSLREGSVEEERRLLYVAISRAMDTVSMTHCERRFIHGHWGYGYPSRFIQELRPHTKELR